MDYETTRTAANCFSQPTKGDVFTQLLSWYGWAKWRREAGEIQNSCADHVHCT